jgi:flagellar motor switch protein FliN/FliY
LLLDAVVAEQLAPRPAAAPAPRAEAGVKPKAQPAGNGQEKHKFQVIEPPTPSERREQLDLILDVPLQVQVVLGRTSILVQDLIHLGEGSILELDKLAGEPVELYIKDRLVALGEVIVVDERFGVKVLELAEHRKTQRPLAS